VSDPTMESRVQTYLALRRNLGCALEREGSLLLDFARYSDRTGHEGPLTTELAVRWAKRPEGTNPIWWARRLDVVRRFARHQVALDPRTEVPLPRLLGTSYHRDQPHIYSDEEISALLRATGALVPINGLRPFTYSTLFGLLASTGLRISEALRLARTDVNLQNGVLRIGETKFYKSRLVPLHATTTAALRRYQEQRDRLCPSAQAGTFFVSASGAALKQNAVWHTFVVLRRRLGWDDRPQRRRPRIHDLRHTMACRRLRAWYEDGTDINQALPLLSTYLGHVNVTNTYWYLSAVPDLMSLASARFERHGAKQ
jgi:integrase